MRLDDPSIQTFLATREIAVLATLQRDGAPLAMPMWFIHDAHAITMISVDGLQKVKNLRRDPRASVVMESHDTQGIRGVAIQGRAEFRPDTPERQAFASALLTKYAGRLEKIWNGRTMPPNRVLFRINPEKVRAWGLS